MNNSSFASSDHTGLPTLCDALIAANRPLDHTGSKAYIDTRTVYPNMRMNFVPWDDFRIESLTQAYGDILSSSLIIQMSGSNSGPEGFTHLGGLKSAFQDDILKSVRQALVKGTGDVAYRLFEATPNVDTEQDDHISRERGYVSGLSLLLRGNNPIRTPRLVVSCFYNASAWHSGWLQQPNTDARLPLRRLAWYCLEADTRYGFIFTDKELVVVRVSAIKSVRSWSSCQVEWKSIPLSNSGPNVLTVKLSLWFLTMMSLHAVYRTICAPGQLLRVNRWWRYRNCELRVVFRHHISMREVVERPEDADVEDMNLIL
ncbi:hypothetical protein FAVG1_00489 [Fusarium avenaceum]|nr:hypothetical protein FAVG1_00489 [Fusarium avenaceum]